MGQTDLEAVVRANHELFMRTGDRAADVVARHRLTLATAQALWAIDPEEAPPSMTVMTERLHCNAPNLSFVTKQLVERGLVERATDPHDRRSRVVVLTDEGRRVRAEIIAETLERTPFAALDGAELRELARLLAKVLAPAGGGA
ncbi:MarR family winged helix-turn-helix transcriptional regulator [Promicromonospora thailandica]|uniref:DNA-binding transcriptional regulator, MarR family n=1 Tax=Promicromonospora thailandica TaxID=765201 RepID=A0A9X2G2I5_9MICO|nr:MarR family winged helix-turn-helix transcriptional regulator [Promicromonospora thailandica]MCP2264268.1 DNA-binding transcriptional regulator, MarR family [Promicromonospora thailandica]BFF21053.1 MarR family winged helix-turn-helix transcriptional regulator [Promicromonospora thailandica]